MADPKPNPNPLTPEQMIFGENLDEFAHRVANICALETGDHISPEEAYHRIKALWKELRHTHKTLLKPDRDPNGH